MASAIAKSKPGLRGKDLITIGIFSAIYFVLNFICMLSGGLHPILWILMPGTIAVLTGIPFLMMCAKVQKFGSVLIMGLIVGLFYFVTGQFTVLILLTFVLACSLAEVLRFLTKYGGFWGNAFAFMVFSLGMTGSPLPIWVMKESFFAQIAAQGMPGDYINTLEAFSSPAMLIVLFAAPVVGALVGACIAKGMFNKHFQKAGIV